MQAVILQQGQEQHSKVPSTTAKVLAVVNPSDKFKAACVASASWSVINGAVEQTLDEVIGATRTTL